MAYTFQARALPGVWDFDARVSASQKRYEEVEGSFTIVKWPDGSARFGAPAKLAWLTNVDQLPDVLNLPYLCVSGRLRDLIQSYEPRVHSFYPTAITLLNGRVDHRYLMHVGQSFDAVSVKHSSWAKSSGVLWTRPPSREKRLVFDTKLIGDRHLWRNNGLGSELNPIASNSLAEAAIEAGITGLLGKRYDQTNHDGTYTPVPISSNRIYSTYAQDRMGPSGHYSASISIKFLDGKPDYIYFEGQPEAEPKKFRYAVQYGRRIDPTNVPTRVYYWQNIKGGVPDIYAYADLPLNVSVRVKDLIEEFEPGVHQFLPVMFVDKKGKVKEERFFLILCTLLDSWSREHSSMLGKCGPYNPGSEQGTIVIDRSKIVGHQIWREKYLHGDLYVTNDIAAIIEESGWPGIAFGGYDLVG